MSGKFKEFHIVCVHDESGFEEAVFFGFRDEIIASNPDYWEFGNPGTLLAYFLSDKDGASRSQSLVARIEMLRESSQKYLQSGFGKSEGKLVVDVSLFGKIKSAPIGLAINEAMKVAREQSSKSVAG